MRKKQHVHVLLEVILWIKRCDGGRKRRGVLGQCSSTGCGEAMPAQDQAQQEPACLSPGGGVAACPPARRLAHAQIWQGHTGISIWVTSIFSGEGGNKSAIDGGRNVG